MVKTIEVASSEYALGVPVLDFDAERFGVNVAEGTVDGNRIGILTATACAIARHKTWQRMPAQPAEIQSILGSPLGEIDDSTT